MIEKLDSLFETVNECKEKTHPCKMSKKNSIKIYKPDSKGIKNKKLEKELFPEHLPKLCDCIMVDDKVKKVVLIEIKCGTVTNSILKEVIEKLTNTFRVLESKEIIVVKFILLYIRFDNKQINKIIATQKINNIPLLPKKYENKAINIHEEKERVS